MAAIFFTCSQFYTSHDQLAIASTGTASSGLFVSGSSLFYNGVQIGGITPATPGTSLSISFNAGATQAAIQAVADNVTFGNPVPNAPLTNRTITFQLADGGGLKAAPATITIDFSN